MSLGPEAAEKIRLIEIISTLNTARVEVARERDRLEEALRQIGLRPLVTEMSLKQFDAADFPGDYDDLIKIARSSQLRTNELNFVEIPRRLRLSSSLEGDF